MKTTKNILAAITLTTALTLNLNAEPENEKPEKVLHKITVEKLEVELQKTPRYSFTGPNVKNQHENKEWLEIEAKINIETVSKLDFLPSLDATFYIVTKIKGKEKGKSEYIKSEKSITFKNVNIENGEAWVCAYVDPDTLRVITGDKRPKVADITGIAVTINSANLHKGKGNASLPYAEEIYDRSVLKKLKRNKSKNVRWWTLVPKSDHSILSLQETPFSAIFSDRYPRAMIPQKMEFALK